MLRIELRQLNYIYLLLILLAINIILSAAMFLQYAAHEIPCPLCLLQRAAFFGIGFGIIWGIREGYSLRCMGLIILFSIYLLVVGVRQSLLDIFPRPGHAWIGSAVLGLHMPEWSAVISVLLLLVVGLQLIVVPHQKYLETGHIEQYPYLQKLSTILIWYLIFLCAINFISVILQCGIHICHTFSYQLLD